MFKNILVAEDHESASISVRKTLADLEITVHAPAYYCDDALLRIQRAQKEGSPFELLITDLSFEEDKAYKQQINTGEQLIRAAREIQPALKVLVFSAEQRQAIIKRLFDNYGIDGYVRKARRDAEQLKAALQTLYKNKKHYPEEFRQGLRQHHGHNFTSYDVTIITQLAQGTPQKDIPVYLSQNGIAPSGLSSVEKRLNLIRESLRFTKNEQLIAYCKDCGII